MQKNSVEISPVMDKLSAYIAGALTTELPPEVVEKTKLHILDTIAAIISGSRLLPGIKAVEYARTQGGAPEALVLGSDLLTNVVTASLANGMAAHAVIGGVVPMRTAADVVQIGLADLTVG